MSKPIYTFTVREKDYKANEIACVNDKDNKTYIPVFNSFYEAKKIGKLFIRLSRLRRNSKLVGSKVVDICSLVESGIIDHERLLFRR